MLLTTVYAVTWTAVGRALGPVRDMTRSAADWGELSHELRTPLARVMAEVELLRRREQSDEDRRKALDLIARSSEQMHRILDTLMAAARAEARLDRGLGDVGDALERIAAEWTPPAGTAPVALEVRAPAEPVVAGVDAAVVERIVAPLLENAARHARSQVVLSAEPSDGRVLVRVADDGPGVPGRGARRCSSRAPPERRDGCNAPHPWTPRGSVPPEERSEPWSPESWSPSTRRTICRWSTTLAASQTSTTRG